LCRPKETLIPSQEKAPKDLAIEGAKSEAMEDRWETEKEVDQLVLVEEALTKEGMKEKNQAIMSEWDGSVIMIFMINLNIKILVSYLMEGKAFTVEEVAKHNKKKDCWVIVHSKVYDVSKFLHKHPAGPWPIFKHAGKDISYFFIGNVAHEKEAMLELEKYLVGSLKIDNEEWDSP